MTTEQFAKLYKSFDDIPEATQRIKVREIVLDTIIAIEKDFDKEKIIWQKEREGLLDAIKGM